MGKIVYLVVYNSGENFHHIAKAFISKKKAETCCKRINTPLEGNSYWSASITEVKLED